MRMFLPVLLGVLTLLLLAACGSPTRQVIKPPVVFDKTQSAKLLFYRKNIPGSNNTIRYWISLNGTDIVGFYGGQYTQFEVIAGIHTVGVRCYNDSYYFNTMLAAKESGQDDGYTELFQSLKAKDDFCFEVDPKTSGSCADVLLITSRACKKIKEEYTSITPGTISD